MDNGYRKKVRKVGSKTRQILIDAKWAFKNMLSAEKKYPKECEEARQDSFRRILAFLEGYSFIDYEVKKSKIPMRCEERVCDIRVPWCWRGYLLR